MCRRAQAQAQPQPMANPPVFRYPTLDSDPPAVDRAVDIGLWQEYDSVSHDSSNLVTRKTFVLGTTDVGGTAQLTLARYDVNGALEGTATWPGPSAERLSLRQARAMTIPVVGLNTLIDDGVPRIFIAASVDGKAGSTDMAVLAFTFSLKLAWMATYTYAPDSPPPGWAGNDDPVAITTDQSLDLVNDGIGYSVVAVLGSSQDIDGTANGVTLAYNASNGCQIMDARRLGSTADVGYFLPADIACARQSALDSEGIERTAIFVTGTYPTPGLDDPHMYTTAYLLPGDTCLTAGSNGKIAAGWPRAYRAVWTPNWARATTRPVRCKVLGFLKWQLIIGATADGIDPSQGAPHDMVTVCYDTERLFPNEPDPEQRSPLWAQTMNFKDTGTNNSRVDVASDLEVFHVNGGAELIAITGSSTGANPPGTAIATQLYLRTQTAGTQLWDEGAMWTHDPASTCDDEGLRCQMIDAPDEAETGSLANLYVTGKSQAATGYRYVSVKYGTLADNSGALKLPAWLDTTIPNTFYNNNGTAGNHIPARICVERKSTAPRSIFVTGTSPGFDDDWATMFTNEHY